MLGELLVVSDATDYAKARDSASQRLWDSFAVESLFGLTHVERQRPQAVFHAVVLCHVEILGGSLAKKSRWQVKQNRGNATDPFQEWE